jgi:hypothetical protein
MDEHSSDTLCGTNITSAHKNPQRSPSLTMGAMTSTMSFMQGANLAMLAGTECCVRRRGRLAVSFGDDDASTSMLFERAAMRRGEPTSGLRFIQRPRSRDTTWLKTGRT